MGKKLLLTFTVMLTLLILLTSDGNAEEVELVSFKSADINGNEVDSRELFDENNITVICIRRDWGSLTVKDRADLIEIQNCLREKGCGLIGIVYASGSVADEADLWKGNSENSFPLILTSDEMSFLPTEDELPLYLFIDGNGTQLIEPLGNLTIQKCEEIIHALFLQNGQETGPSLPRGIEAAANAAGAGNITRTDLGNGYVIECDGDVCRIIFVG